MKKLLVLFLIVLLTLSVGLADDDPFYTFLLNKATGLTSRGHLAGDSLTGNEKIAYDVMKREITKIANNERFSTAIDIMVSDFGINQNEWTPEDLGMTEEEFQYNGETAVKSLLEVNFPEVFSALRVDCAYELYWYDVEGGIITSSYIGKSTDENGIVKEIRVRNGIAYTAKCSVAVDYKAQGNYMKANIPVDTILETAGNIVNQNRGLSDYQKLVAYKNAICEMTSYNQNADSQISNNPFQLIWVFDGDPTTEVVCEGYSKAFQFLVEQTAFQGNVRSYLVEGTMWTDGPDEPHMWNSVTMGDENYYLVDVTNCDGNGVGAPDLLFMKGMENPWSDSIYMKNVNNTDVYYWVSDRNPWPESVITFASSDYVEQDDGVEFSGNTIHGLQQWEEGPIYYPPEGYDGRTYIVRLEMEDGSAITEASVAWTEGNEALSNLFKVENEEEDARWIIGFQDEYGGLGTASFRVTATSNTGRAYKDFTVTVMEMSETAHEQQLKQSVNVAVGDTVDLSALEIVSNSTGYRQTFMVRKGNGYSSRHERTADEPYSLTTVDGHPIFTAYQAGKIDAFVQIRPSVNLTRTFDFSIVVDGSGVMILPDDLATIENDAFKGVKSKTALVPEEAEIDDAFDSDVVIIRK